MATAWDAFPVSPTAAYANFCTSPPKRSTPTPTPSSYDRSSILSARLQLHPLPASTTTPTLPPEIIRRIIRAALSVPSSIPGAAQGVPTAAWDEFAGRAARRRISSQVAVRTQVTRTARSLMMVCRAWKPLVLTYLYADPAVTSDNVASLARAVVHGDSKWSDLHLHPHSYPGRWITVLDLSNLAHGRDAVAVARAVSAVLELSPGLKHLSLPPSGVRIADLRDAPCARSLRCLEGVHLSRGGSEDDVVRFLRVAKTLEVLGLVWTGPGDVLEDIEFDDGAEEAPPPSLSKLHTLTLVAAHPGPLLSALTRAELPSLSRLVLSPYDQGLELWEDDAARGGSRALQHRHGSKIRSLTYVTTPGWPPDTTLPAHDTLSLHPNLVHLHLALPHALLNEHPELAPAFARPNHPLAHLTIPRWPRIVQAASPPQADDYPPGNRFLAALSRCRSRIRVVSIDGFNWVQPALGFFAAQSGDSGMMRTWATWLGKAGVELLDMDGASAPVIERGRPGVSGARRTSIEHGWKSIEGGRKSNEGRRPSLRPSWDSDGG